MEYVIDAWLAALVVPTDPPASSWCLTPHAAAMTTQSAATFAQAAASSNGVAKAGCKQKWSDIADEADDVSTAMPESSKLPDDDSDMETMRTDSTRLSNSRSHASRGAGRKKRDKAKYLENCRAKFEAQGKVFVVKDEDTFKQEQRTNMLHRCTASSDGCVIDHATAEEDAAAATSKILAAAAANQMTAEEKMERKMLVDSFFYSKVHFEANDGLEHPAHNPDMCGAARWVGVLPPLQQVVIRGSRQKLRAHLQSA